MANDLAIFKPGTRIYVIGRGCADEGQVWEIGNDLNDAERVLMLTRLKNKEVILVMDGGKNEHIENTSKPVEENSPTPI